MQLRKISQLFVQQAKELEKELIAIRRHLHKYPELSFEEFETSKFIEDQLRKRGLPIERISKTGILTWIEGEKDDESLPFTVGLRADIDALPIKEETGVPFASVNDGVMHACGHDGHTTMLLGATFLLHENRHLFNGKVACVFQYGEEDDGAAKEMIDLGVLEKPAIDLMVALHLWPYLPFGKVGVRRGGMTASCDDFTITIHGKSGHSARPHEGIDAISIATKVIEALEHFVLKTTNPLHPVVVHIGKIQGGTARNVIADQVTLEGTARALSIEDRSIIKDEVHRLAKMIGETYGATIDVDYIDGTAPVINDDQVTTIVAEAAREQWGDEYVTELKKPSLGADDFGEFSLKVPSTYFRLGIKKENEKAYSLHHPKFNFDDQLLKHGAALFAYIATKALKNQEE